MVVSFIGGGNRNIWRKPATGRKSLTNFITQHCIEYTSLWAGFKLTTLVMIGTDCICSCKSNYHAIAYYHWRCNQEGEGWDPINLFKPTTFLGQPRARTWISNFISNMWSLLCAMVWGDSDRRLSILLILVELLTITV